MDHPKLQTLGLRKAAVLLLTLPTELAATLLAKLDREQIQAVAAQIAQLGTIARQEQDGIVQEFSLLESNLAASIRGNLDAATVLLQRLPAGAGRDVLNNLRKTHDRRPFAFLHHLDSDLVVRLLKNEHPQCLAVILSYLSPGVSAYVLARLPTNRQIEVVRRIANMKLRPGHAVAALENAVQRRLSQEVHSVDQQAGLFRAAEILSAVDPSSASALREHLTTEAPELAERVWRLTLRFEHLNQMSSAEMRVVLRNVPIPVWAVALKGCSPTLVEKVTQHLTDEDVLALQSSDSITAAASATDVESAQLDIVRTLYRLRYEGKILLSACPEAELADTAHRFHASRAEAA